MQQLKVNTDKPGEYATETHPEGYGFFAIANCSDISGMSANPNNPTVSKALDDSGEKDSLVTGRDLWEDHSSSMKISSRNVHHEKFPTSLNLHSSFNYELYQKGTLEGLS